MTLDEILTNQNAALIAEEIISIFELQTNEKNLEIDFKLNAGVMEKHYPTADLEEALYKLHGQKVALPNTSFSFDAPDNSKLFELKSIVCKLIDGNEMNENDYDKLSIFLASVINGMNNNKNHLERLKAAIRKVNHAPADVFTFNDARVVLFEFGDKEDYGDMIKVANYSRYNKQLQGFVGEKKAVAQDLLLRRREFGYQSKMPTVDIYSLIIDEQKRLNNPKYADLLIEDVKIVKEAKECHLDIFVDYSPISKEEYEAKITEIEASHGAE